MCFKVSSSTQFEREQAVARNMDRVLRVPLRRPAQQATAAMYASVLQHSHMLRHFMTLSTSIIAHVVTQLHRSIHEQHITSLRTLAKFTSLQRHHCAADLCYGTD